MASNPTVTAVMPAYNGERFIGAAIESALGQTYRDFELVVVDDGSTDRTAEIARGYAERDERISVIQQANAGPGAARNAGIEHGRGKYIAFLDQDDLWLPTKLEKQVVVLDDAPEQVGVVYSWVVYVDAENRLTGTYQAMSEEGNVYLKLLVFLTNVPTVQLIRRTALEKCGLYPTDIISAHDLDLNLRLARHYDFRVVREFVTAFRVHEASLTYRHALAIEEFNAIRQRVAEQDRDVPSAVMRWGDASFNAYVAARLWRQDRMQAVRKLFEAIRTDPAIAVVIALNRFRKHNRLSRLPPRERGGAAEHPSAVESVMSDLAWVEAQCGLPQSMYIDPIRRNRIRFMERHSRTHLAGA